MKLRTRLFLSLSALVTVALLGLALGLISVLQMASVQQQMVRETNHTLDIGLKLRQNLGEQLTLILDPQTDPKSLTQASARALARRRATTQAFSGPTATAQSRGAAWAWITHWALPSIRCATT